MKTPVISLKPTNTIKDAAEIMLNKNIGRVSIVDERGKLIGTVDREDIVKALL
ncbi:MAG: CBS domain protein [Candidatus Bathyarchaeota archaeon BA1]|nr:MAG: CBS domain protein [Candidatus Bathyarchaeota archaeon BA1]